MEFQVGYAVERVDGVGLVYEFVGFAVLLSDIGEEAAILRAQDRKATLCYLGKGRFEKEFRPCATTN